MDNTQLKKVTSLKNKLQQLENTNSISNECHNLLTNIITGISNIEEHNQNKYSLTKEQKHVEEGMINSLRHDLNNLVNKNPNNSLLELTYKLLVLLTKIHPLNKWDGTEYSDKWICPITSESLGEYFYDRYRKSVALTSGYLYDREALIKWFTKSRRFIDPVTSVALPQFDIDRLGKYHEGIIQIQKIREDYENNRNRLLQKQENRFDKPLNTSDQIKKDFLELTAKGVSSDRKDFLSERIKKNVQILDIHQLKSKSNKSNFSNLNLSGLYFYDNHLASKDGSEIDLRGADLSNCVFFQPSSTSHCMHGDYSGANLENARFLNFPDKGVCIKTSDFTNANLRNVDFTGIGNWNGVILKDANLSGAFLYNAKGEKITGERLKKRFANISGSDSAIFTENNNNNNNNTSMRSLFRSYPDSATSCFQLQPNNTVTKVSIFKHNNTVNSQENNLLKEQNQRLQTQNQNLQVQNQQIQSQLQQLEQKNTHLQQQNRLFSQHLQQQQPQQQQPQQQQYKHHHRKHEHCIVM